MLKIKRDFSYKAYHSGIKCTIASLSQNRITHITRWSQIEETVRFKKIFTSSQKQNILHEQVATMGFKSICERKYSNATIVRAFCYFALSKTAYRRFCQDFELPSISTLTRLISSAKSYDDVLFQNIFKFN